MDSPLVVSSSPHIHDEETTRSIMLDVCIGLLFPLALSTYYFELRALYLTTISVVCCVGFEYLYRRLMKKNNTTRDLSAVVTGMLLAFTLPVSAPYWVAAVGAFFAIVVVKQLYGGLGKNFMNPALSARAFLVISFPSYVSNFTEPTFLDDNFSFLVHPDAVSAATPLAALKQGMLPEDVTLQNLLFGEIPGSLGEVSSLMLLVGGLWLLVRRVITPRVPLSFLGTVAALTFLLAPPGVAPLEYMLFSLLSGGLMLGAIFMATDYSTSPVTKRGQILFGIGCGLLTVFLRDFSKMPEGVCFAILIMNTLVWALDKAGRARRFGEKPLVFLFRRKGGGRT
ncbi:MAG: RnfABCDGE type electron transport complex subunit D [Oscillospiraceae bacterium]|nr:RnfABCDGE type electron transport complex subunit D [Oscillospiraceae bacterium]